MDAPSDDALLALRDHCVALQMQIDAHLVILQTLTVLLSHHPELGNTLQHFSNAAHACLLNGAHGASDDYIRGFDAQLRVLVHHSFHERLGI